VNRHRGRRLSLRHRLRLRSAPGPAITPDEGRDDASWGSEPSDEEWTEVERLDEQLRAEARERVSEVSAPLEAVPEITGWAKDEVEGAVERGDILALDHNGTRIVPLWQFSHDEPAEIMPAISELSRAFGQDVIALTAWVVAPNPHLGGKTPQQALATGDRDAVLRAIASMGAAAF